MSTTLTVLCIILAAALWRVVRLQRLTSARLSVCRALRTHDRAQRRDAERRAVEAHRQWCDAMARAEAAEVRADAPRPRERAAADQPVDDDAREDGGCRDGVAGDVTGLIEESCGVDADDGERGGVVPGGDGVGA